MLGKIVEMAHEISANRKADVFANYMGHVKTLDVSIWMDGWAVNRDKTYEKSIRMRGKEGKDIQEVIEILQQVLDNQPPVLEAGQCSLCKRKLYSDETFKQFKSEKICKECADELNASV